MKKLLLTLLACCAIVPSVQADDLDAAREKVKNIFISDEEPTTKDAIWSTPSVFKVGVKDNGTNRNGYAEYVCLTLGEHGFNGKGIMVKVIDIDKLVKTGKWVDLGMAQCP